MTISPVRIVQITDIHHFADKNRALLGCNTHESYMAVLELIKQTQNQFEMILLTGDISQDYTEQAYIHIADAIKELKVPVYWIAGNHDDDQKIINTYPRDTISNLKHIVLEHWHIIMLDSHQQGRVEGFLDSTQLDYLQHCLQLYPERHAMVVLHHHPVPMGSVWIDKIGLTNADAFWEVLSHYPMVKMVLCGHVHQEHEAEKQGIKFFSTPSTCIQFKTQSADFGLEKLSPGYRWIDLYPNGEIKTKVCRTAEYIGDFDTSSRGY